MHSVYPYHNRRWRITPIRLLTLFCTYILMSRRKITSNIRTYYCSDRYLVVPNDAFVSRIKNAFYMNNFFFFKNTAYFFVFYIKFKTETTKFIWCMLYITENWIKNVLNNTIFWCKGSKILHFTKVMTSRTEYNIENKKIISVEICYE